jgi:hypothetical protein
MAAILYQVRRSIVQAAECLRRQIWLPLYGLSNPNEYWLIIKAHQHVPTAFWLSEFNGVATHDPTSSKRDWIYVYD